MYRCMNMKYMKAALAEAKKALIKGEIPIGCVIVKDDKIIARGHNLTETKHDPTAHAEMVALRKAGKVLGESLGWRRLTGCDMYVTMEPCSMCAGALVWARIETVYIGNKDPKAGGCGSVLDITGEPRLNHHVEVVEIEDGPLKDECKAIVQNFFKNLRDQQKLAKQKAEEE